LVPIRRGDNPRLRLLCFPYGGGGAASFWSWQADLPPDCELWAIRLPGRESRLAEPLGTDAGKAVEAIAGELARTRHMNWVFYGHSLGAGLALETAKLLRARNAALPLLFLASGRLPPHHSHSTGWADRPEDELMAHLMTLDGIAPEFLENAAFKSSYVRKIRADFRLNDDLPPLRVPAFDFPVTVINGMDDPLVNDGQLQEWREYTSRQFASFRVGGGHFFIKSHIKEFIRILSEQLTGLRRVPAAQ